MDNANSNANLSSTPPPVFVLSTERSGSTLLRFILDTHPDIASPGELMIGSVCNKLMRVFRRTVYSLMEDQQASIHSALETRGVVMAIMRRYLELKTKTIWCDKSPGNWAFAADLDIVFPSARYIILTRHYADVIYSCIESGKFGFAQEFRPYIVREGGDIVRALATSWLEKMRAILAFEQRCGDRCHRVRYEDLVERPDVTVRDVLQASFSVDMPRDLLDHVFSTRHDSGGGDNKINFERKIHTRSVGRGIFVLRDLIPQDLKPDLDAIMHQVSVYPSTL
jgi:hypothetical protein